MKALEIDDNLGEAHAALAQAKMVGDWEGSGCRVQTRIGNQPGRRYDEAVARALFGFPGASG
jgi:hypothetical protein